MGNTENKTKATDNSVDLFLSELSENRKAEALELIKIMEKISNEKAVMWGDSIIGFSSMHYKYESGREGDVPAIGFSPRKAKITIYFMEGFNSYGEELQKLGKHKLSMSCLYINKLKDIDLDILKTMIEKSYNSEIIYYKKEDKNILNKKDTIIRQKDDIRTSHVNKSEDKDKDKDKAITTVEEYIENIPDVSKKRFFELRDYVKKLIPNAEEVYSYGIIGYKIDKKRARVFISAWKDHLGVYPLPKDQDLLNELKPYIKGKGTMWFSLKDRLPKRLIKRIVEDLTC